MKFLPYLIVALGYGGLLMNLAGVKLVKNTQTKQLFFGIGAALLGVMAAYPVPFWVFVVCQTVASMAAWLRLAQISEKITRILVGWGAVSGAAIALYQQADVITYLGIAGLVGIAVGFGSKPESEGGIQNHALLMGGIFMVIYSAVGVWQIRTLEAGVLTPLAFLILNIPFAYWSYKNI